MNVITIGNFLPGYYSRSFVHFQSYKSFSDKSGIFPDLASTTSLMLGRGSISSAEADEADWGEWEFLLSVGNLRRLHVNLVARVSLLPLPESETWE